MASSQDKVQHYLGQLDKEVRTKALVTRAARPSAPSCIWPLTSQSLVPSRQIHGHRRNN